MTIYASIKIRYGMTHMSWQYWGWRRKTISLRSTWKATWEGPILKTKYPHQISRYKSSMYEMESALYGVSSKLCVVEERVVKLKVQSYNLSKRKRKEDFVQERFQCIHCLLHKSEDWHLVLQDPSKAQAFTCFCHLTAAVERWEGGSRIPGSSRASCPGIASNLIRDPASNNERGKDFHK